MMAHVRNTTRFLKTVHLCNLLAQHERHPDLVRYPVLQGMMDIDCDMIATDSNGEEITARIYASDGDRDAMSSAMRYALTDEIFTRQQVEQVIEEMDEFHKACAFLLDCDEIINCTCTNIRGIRKLVVVQLADMIDETPDKFESFQDLLLEALRPAVDATINDVPNYYHLRDFFYRTGRLEYIFHAELDYYVKELCVTLLEPNDITKTPFVIDHSFVIRTLEPVPAEDPQRCHSGPMDMASAVSVALRLMFVLSVAATGDFVELACRTTNTVDGILEVLDRDSYCAHTLKAFKQFIVFAGRTHDLHARCSARLTANMMIKRLARSALGTCSMQITQTETGRQTVEKFFISYRLGMSNEHTRGAYENVRDGLPQLGLDELRCPLLQALFDGDQCSLDDRESESYHLCRFEFATNQDTGEFQYTGPLPAPLEFMQDYNDVGTAAFRMTGTKTVSYPL